MATRTNDDNATTKDLKRAWRQWGETDPRVGSERNSYKAFLRWLAASDSSFRNAAKRALEGK